MKIGLENISNSYFYILPQEWLWNIQIPEKLGAGGGEEEIIQKNNKQENFRAKDTDICPWLSFQR